MPADPDEARRTAEQVLGGPEYREAATPWWRDVVERVDRALGELFGTLGGSGGSALVGWVVVVLVVAAAAVVVALAVRSLLRHRRGSTVGDEDVATTRRRRREEPDPAALDAAALEAEGRWREGMRARYRDLVARLTERAVLDPAASRTTGEHRREVGANAPPAAAEFDAAAELFDRAWYGNRPTGPEEAERFSRLAEDVEDRVGQAPR